MSMRSLKSAATRARNKPGVTCPASRHVHDIALTLAAGKPYYALDEEPQHCAASMLALVATVWELRAKLQELSGDAPARRGESET